MNVLWTQFLYIIMTDRHPKCPRTQVQTRGCGRIPRSPRQHHGDETVRPIAVFPFYKPIPGESISGICAFWLERTFWKRPFYAISGTKKANASSPLLGSQHGEPSSIGSVRLEPKSVWCTTQIWHAFDGLGHILLLRVDLARCMLTPRVGLMFRTRTLFAAGRRCALHGLL